MGFLQNFFNIGVVELEHSNNTVEQVERVYSHDDLCVKAYFTSWNTISIDGKPELINKVLEHLRTATNYKVYINNFGITFSCDTKKFGKVECHYRSNYLFFEFGILKSHTRYDINYDIKDHKEFREFLDSKFKKYIDDFKNDTNL